MKSHDFGKPGKPIHIPHTISFTAEDLVLYPQLHRWSSSILALHLHAPGSGNSVICQEEPEVFDSGNHEK